jgi:hypothetical protein
MPPTSDNERATERRLPSTTSTQVNAAPRDDGELTRRERSWRRVQAIRKAAGGLAVGDSGCH